MTDDSPSLVGRAFLMAIDRAGTALKRVGYDNRAGKPKASAVR